MGYIRFSIWTLAAAAFAASPEPVGAQVNFNEHIRPIFDQHCIVCHGPDEESRAAGLRVDQRSSTTSDRGGYAAIVPGDAEASEMVYRISSEDDPMPPADHGERLSTDEIELIRQWIEQGAAYEKHWSFQSIERPVIPDVIEDPWCQNAIDAFVLNRLNAAGLKPNLAEEPARLVRRLALDLTGLPPSQAMVDRYISSPTDATWEAIVDELLADPAYGEHWASMWMDLARYADTQGYAGDERRTIWPWRDWLIQSLNDNQPLDQFTLEVLAGDLLPLATERQRLATAFHRNTLNNNEGGTNNEEFRTVAVKDRLSTTLNTWMGLTIRCAECHSHKFDPISNEEYYQLLDFFNQTADADRPNESPTLEWKPVALREQAESVDRQIADLMKQKRSREPAWQVIRPSKMVTAYGTQLRVLDDGSILATGPNPTRETWSITFQVPSDQSLTGLRIEVLPHPYHGGRVGRGEGGSFVMTQVKVTPDPQDELSKPIALSAATADFAERGLGPKHLIRRSIAESDEPNGWRANHPQQGFDRPRAAVVQFENPLSVRSRQRIEVDLVFNSQWHHSNPGRIRLAMTKVDQPAKTFRSAEVSLWQAKLNRLIRQRNQVVRVPVLDELPTSEQRTTRIMKRGNFQNLGEIVHAATPASFHPFRETWPRNRLGLAYWLVDRRNPLTARVAVNRYWARLFGRGLVETEEDFGTQGTSPSHPGLLDWLATEFRNDWDVKRLLKLMVMSATYRQSAVADDHQIARDPDNRLLSRGPRNRLSAEAIRDQALAVSGLLSRKMYGAPVYPPNPIKKVVNAFKGADVWQTSKGEDRYRRSLYTFLKRSQPHPLFETFDMATRDVCCLRRIETNTPLQSFMTLNSRMFIEAAQALAVRMSEESGVRAQIARGLALALKRTADAPKIDPLQDLYQKSLNHYQANPKQAAEMTGRFGDSVPEHELPQLAALTVVANVILNLDEFLTH